jgi:hypothetical protein
MYRHPETGIEFPDQASGFARGEPRRYSATPTEQGVAIPYQLGRTAATVFVRSATGDAATVDAIIAQGIGAIREMERMGKYSHVQLFQGSDEGAWKRLAFMARVEGAVVVSFVNCRILGKHAIRLRVTGQDFKDERMQTFIHDLCACVDAAAVPE